MWSADELLAAKQQAAGSSDLIVVYSDNPVKGLQVVADFRAKGKKAKLVSLAAFDARKDLEALALAVLVDGPNEKISNAYGSKVLLISDEKEKPQLLAKINSIAPETTTAKIRGSAKFVKGE